MNKENEIGKVRSACALCQNFCGLIAHVSNGVVVKLEGDPENPRNHGHLCAKGLSGHLSMYSPRRFTSPMIRTNESKGPGVDPRWKPIGWEEALTLVADRIREVRSASGGFHHKIFFVTYDHWSAQCGALAGWLKAADAIYGSMGASCFCGNAVHPPSYLNVGGFEITPDAQHVRYLMLVGAQSGSMVHYDTMSAAKHIADKRPGQIRVVAVDPVCSHAASKAEEWVPIRPGTDAAFLLALVHLLVNEYKVYDTKFLKERTNAPYLVGEDGRYLREAASHKPMIWDAADRAAKAFDSQVEDPALEGSFEVKGAACEPSFQRVALHVKRYTPEYASSVTTIPSDTISRLAREIADSACIGQSIRIGDAVLPYRPVSLVWYRGLSAHRHSYLAGTAALLIPTLLGAIQVPGGITARPKAAEYVTADGMIASVIPPQKTTVGAPYPPRPVVRPKRLDLFELFPSSIYSRPMVIPTLLNPERFGLDESSIPAMMFVFRDNAVGNTFAPETVVEAFKRIPFIVAISVEPDETTNLADLVLPDLHHLEKLAEGLYSRVDEPGYWYASKPVVSPPFEEPYDKLLSVDQIFLDIARRAGFLGECYRALNTLWQLQSTPYELDPNALYEYEDLVDRRLKALLGPRRGLEWLRSDEGGLLVGSAAPGEVYRGPSRKGRLHLYYEFLLDAGRDVKTVTEGLGLPWDVADYQPIPDWKPCLSYLKRDSAYDLYLVNYKVPTQIHGIGRSNPILRSLTEDHGHDSVLINAETAKRKGITDGDDVILETIKGRKATGRVRLTERIHPEVLGTMQHKLAHGADFNSLVTLDNDTMDFVGCAVDSCLLVRISKA